MKLEDLRKITFFIEDSDGVWLKTKAQELIPIDLEEFWSPDAPMRILIGAHGTSLWFHDQKVFEVNLALDLKRHHYFYKNHSIVKEHFAKAVGIKQGYRPKVLDTTAGHLSDAMLLYSWGCDIVCYERHLVQFMVMKVELLRSSLFDFKYSWGCSSELQDMSSFDCVYFDPMFSHVSEKTKSKKNIEWMRDFLGADEDQFLVAQKLFEQTRGRLVIKRSLKSDELIKGPSLVFHGKGHRFDVYLKDNKKKLC